MADQVSPAVGIKAIIQEAPSLVLAGWDIAVGWMLDKPDRFITIYDTGGESPDPKLRLDRPSVQVVIRTDPRGYIDGATMAKSIKKRLLGVYSHRGVTPTSYPEMFSCVMQGDINMLGRDANSRPTWSLNFRLIVEPTEADQREPL